MKKYLYSILLFVSCNVCRYETVYAQVSINVIDDTRSSTDFGSTIIMTNRSFVAGRLYIMAVQISKNTAPNLPSISGTGQTWTQIADVSSRTTASPTSRLSVFRFLAASTFIATTTITIPTAELHTGYEIIALEVTGADTSGANGSGAIVQAVTNSADASLNPSISMSPISNSSNAVMAFFVNNANPFAATPKPGWTEYIDAGYSSPATGSYYMSRLTTTDNTPTVTASASDWAGVAIELKSLARRRVIIVN